MLQVATPATLSRYARRLEERCLRYPRAWYLAVTADDRCRSEFWPAEMRRQERFHSQFLALSSFQPAMPWESVIKEATTNVEFWAREFQEPALLYMKERADTAPSWTTQQPPESSWERGAKRRLNEGDVAADPHRKVEGHFVTDRHGTEICRLYSKGTCHKETCHYVHVCAYCRGSHAALGCTSKGKGRGKGKNKKGKGKKGKEGDSGDKP